MPEIEFIELEFLDSNVPHEFCVYRPEGSGWLDAVADTYVALRTACHHGDIDTMLEGLEFADRNAIRAHLAAASVPRVSTDGPLSIMRADLGEVLAYELLERRFSTQIGYKLVCDRELVQLPGRGIDAIGAEYHPHPADGVMVPPAVPPLGAVEDEERSLLGESFRLVLAEVKVSDETASPPQVVDRKRDAMRKQHRAHMSESRQTTDKVWQAARKCRDKALGERLLHIALQMERNFQSVPYVACCVLVRPESKVRPTDRGSFHSSPSDYSPAAVRFITVALPDSMADIMTEWRHAVARAVARHGQERGRAAA
jgi:hypothetical protein